MKLKNLAAAAVCVAAIGGTAAAAPAAAKSDNGHGKIRRCEVGNAKKFKCVTDSGEVVTGSCPTGYDVTATVSTVVDLDVNNNGLICSSAALGYVDDTAL
ncbi:MAG TPA: hypothetical protein VJT75_14195 [Thermoleophilaceae bacterium]|nr:hypothetical protein [Thermoleophilaceae bacterium]